MFSATPNPVEVTCIPLGTPADLGNALNAALSFGYRGTVSVHLNGMEQPVWLVELNGPGNVDQLGREVPVHATLGDVFVWDQTKLDAMTQEAFDVKYSPA